MAESDGAALLDLATRLNLRTGQLVEALLMLEEVAVRERITIASVLVRGEVRAALGASGSGPGRATNFIHALRALRFPRLLDLRRRLGEQIRALCLPRGVSVILPRDLNSDELKIELRVRSGRELREHLSALEARRPGLEQVIELLGGGDEL